MGKAIGLCFFWRRTRTDTRLKRVVRRSYWFIINKLKQNETILYIMIRQKRLRDGIDGKVIWFSLNQITLPLFRGMYVEINFQNIFYHESCQDKKYFGNNFLMKNIISVMYSMTDVWRKYIPSLHKLFWIYIILYDNLGVLWPGHADSNQISAKPKF